MFTFRSTTAGKAKPLLGAEGSADLLMRAIDEGVYVYDIAKDRIDCSEPVYEAWSDRSATSPG